MKKQTKKLAAIAVLSIFTCTCFGPTATLANNSINNLQQQKTQINQQKSSIQKEINSNKQEKNKLTQQLQQINREMDTVQQNIEALNSEIAETESQIDFTKMEIANKQRDYDGRMALFNQRLKQMYQYGNVNFLEVLLQSSSLSDFLTRFEYLKYIANNDQKLLDEVTVLKNKLETEKKNLDSMMVTLETKKQNQVARTRELESTSQQKAQLVAEIEADQEVLFAMVAEMEAEAKRLNSEIQRLQAEEAAKAAKNGVTTKAPGSYVWPCPASRTITSNYGYRIHPVSGVKKLHTGLDIGAPYGANVVAAAGGTVIMSQYYGGYGNCIIVDHGGGVSTLYAHMSSLVAKKGQTVTQGQVIGKVGSTGTSTGNHLHFEVRINGATTNPANYV